MSDKKFRPMKPPSGSIKLEQVQFPTIVSPKIDGIRATVQIHESGYPVLHSSSMKLIPNNHIRMELSNAHHLGLDGELTVVDPTDPMCFRKTTSAVMSHTGTPDYTYWVFDYLKREQAPFKERFQDLRDWEKHFNARVRVVPHTMVHNMEQLVEAELKFVEQGYEGIMMRSPDGLYKYGRSTVTQGWVLRFKRFQDDEAVVIGFLEGNHNENEQKINVMGLAERSTVGGNKKPNGMLGSFQVRDLKTGVEFSIGIGLSQKLCQQVWDNKEKYLSKIVKYRHFPVGGYDLPRFPAFKGFRDQDDMTDY